MCCAHNISAFLINTSNSSIKKPMFYRVAILAYFNYFLYCPCYSLTKSMEAKIAETNLAKGSIKVIFAKGTSV